MDYYNKNITFNQTYWLGLTDLEEEGKFKWFDGSPLDFTAWAEGALDKNNDRINCVYMKIPGYKWHLDDCDNEHQQSFSQKYYHQLCNLTNWVKSPMSGYCYQHFQEPKTWSDAAKQCNSFAFTSRLPTFADRNMHEFYEYRLTLVDLFDHHKPTFEKLWLSGKKLKGEKVFKWQTQELADLTIFVLQPLCPDGWINYKDQLCFLVINETKTLIDAAAHCANFDSHLLYFDKGDIIKEEFIDLLSIPVVESLFWTNGGRSKAAPTSFLWRNNKVAISQFFTNVGENEHLHGDCLVLSTTQFLLKHPCNDDLLPFICARKVRALPNDIDVFDRDMCLAVNSSHRYELFQVDCEKERASFSCEKRSLCYYPFNFTGGYTELLDNNTLYEARLRVICFEEYKLNISEILICGTRGVWTEQITSPCIKKRCFYLKYKYGKYTGSTIVKSKYVLECNYGYIIKSNNFTICLLNEQWSRPYPQCILVTCPFPSPSPKIRTILAEGHSSLNYNSTIRFECEKGYHPVGPNEGICTVNGSWSIKVPKCKEKECENDTWVSFADFCYFKSDKLLTFDEAVEFCKTQNANLTDILSQEEQNSFKDFNTGTEDVMWTSGTRQYNDDWLWINTGGTLGYTNWKQGQPSSTKGQEDCIYIDSNGEWNDGLCSQKYLALCKKGKFCSIPEELDNGYYEHVNGTMNYFLSTIKYYCNDRYVLVGHAVLTCTFSQKWEPAKPYCEIPQNYSCESPDNILFVNGYYEYINNVTLNTHLSQIEFRCFSGYKIFGNDIVSCWNNSQWNIDDFPHCEFIDCGPPANISDGYYIMPTNTTYLFEPTFRYSCYPGFKIENDFNITCLESGDWSSPPYCVVLDCGTPPDIEHGNYTILTDTYLSGTVFYYCEESYDLLGESIISCLISGNWSDMPVCGTVDCEFNFNITNANIRKPIRAYLGALVNITCVDGYKLIGNTSIECMEDSNWSTLPTCEIIDCGTPGGITNGRVFYQKTEYTSAAVYLCNAGFILIGHKTIHCIETGLWSYNTPLCEMPSAGIDCQKPRDYPNSFVILVNNVTTHLALAEYHCIPTHRLVQGSSVIQCQRDNNWNSTEIVCEAIYCSDPNLLDNGYIDTIYNLLYSELTYKCNPGYRHTDPTKNKIMCRLPGNWDYPYPLSQCVKIHCDQPPPVTYGDFRDKKAIYEYRDQVVYICDKPRIFVGSNVTVCLETGKWDLSRNPECLSRSEYPFCDSPTDNLINGTISLIRLDYGILRLTYTCIFGYTRNGPEHSFCTHAAGTWNETPPVCIVNDCGPPPHDATVRCERQSQNEAICECIIENYVLRGDHIITCDHTLQWRPPVCEELNCRPPPPVINGTFTVTEGSNTVGSLVHYYCPPGYAIFGQNVAICSFDIQGWNITEEPVCQIIIHCEDRSTDPFLHFSNGTTQTSIQEYMCPEGQIIVGKHIITCLSNGSWSSDSPSCREINCPPAVPPMNGHVQLISLNSGYRAVVQYSCLQNFEMLGSLFGYCDHTEKWNQTAICSALPRPRASLYLNKMSYWVHEELRGKCKFMRANPTPTIKILIDGKDDPRNCRMELPHLIKGGFYHSAHVEFSCTLNEENLHNGNINITCQLILKNEIILSSNSQTPKDEEQLIIFPLSCHVFIISIELLSSIIEVVKPKNVCGK